MTLEMDVDEGRPPEPKDELQAFSPELLRFYYSRLFPYDLMYRWLSYANMPAKVPEADGNAVPSEEKSDFFQRREFSFTIEDDIYIRYLCFADCAEFEQQVQRKQPHKIDIGAVFSLPPKDHLTVKQEAFVPMERELVFDIDLTDYDNVRTCCSGAKICRRCWSYMVMAVEVMDRGLRQDFGFHHILWVYSGRRGVHCWVSDDVARALTNEGRAAVADYFTVVAGNDNQSSKGQGLLSDPEKREKLFASLPFEGMGDDLEASWEGKKVKGLQTAPEQWRYEVVFEHCYPRLDVNVSKSRNHLLKSPFAVHPKTGRVCVPIDPTRVSEFNPFAVPTLGELMRQIDRFDTEKGDEAKGVRAVDKTSMKAAVACFENTFLKGLSKGFRAKLRDKAERKAAAIADF